MNLLHKVIGFAHRGASAYEPENTLRAFRRAVKMGVRGLESDARLSKDGYIVLVHDDTLAIDKQKIAVSEHTLTELQKIDVGLGEHIPRLEEVLEAFKSYDLWYSIDIKSPKAGMSIIEIAREYGLVERIGLCHPNFTILRSIRKIYPHAYLIMSTNFYQMGCSLKMLCEKCVREKISTINLPFWDINITPEGISLIHSYGLRSFVWDVQKEEQMHHLITWGVDGLYSEYPDRLKRVIDKEDLHDSQKI